MVDECIVYRVSKCLLLSCLLVIEDLNDNFRNGMIQIDIA